MEYRPDFTLTAEGKDITAAIRQGLVSIQLTDYGGASGKSDTLVITLTSETLTLPPKGARLQLALGFNGVLVDKGAYVVCNVQSSGPPRMLTINATATPSNTSKQPADTTAQKNRVFSHTTLGDIVTSIATANQLKARISERLANIVITHEIQHGESDGAFLLRLARQYNAVSKPTHGYWLFIDRGQAQRAGGGNTSRIIITPDRVTHWSYNDGERGAANQAQKSGSLGVDYFNEATGAVETHHQRYAGSDSQHPLTQPDRANAEQAAAAATTHAEQGGRSMQLSGPAWPSLIGVSAECCVETQGFGVMEDMSWKIESLCLLLTKSGFRFEMKLNVNF